jgi:hypothetical protein
MYQLGRIAISGQRGQWRQIARAGKMEIEESQTPRTMGHSMKPSSTDPFKQREIGLEEAFFKERDRQLMEKMRSELSAFEDQKKLAHVTGIVEERVLANLVQAGVRAETLAAVTLIPMVEVAWCDGAVSPEERDAVLNAAVGQGIHPGSAAYELLAHWLAERPDPKIITAWKDYVREMVHLMPKDTIATMKKAALDRCKRVAAAAGGFLGLSTISKHEQAKIDEIAKAWEG